MDSDTTDFLSLIKGPRQYRIPPFQRPYSWEKEDRETLWLDILAQYEKLEKIWDKDKDEREELLKKIAGHYLGTVVLAGPSALGVPKSDVIDGQQRITTILLLLCALRDVRARAELRGEGTLAERESRADAVRGRVGRRYLENEDESGSDRLRVVPLATDRRAFEAIINYKGVGALTPESLGLDDADSKRVLTAYKFFTTELRRQKVNTERATQLARFAKLFPLNFEILEEVVTRRLILIAIETANLDDVNSIFESLNATGRPLTQLDLLRNYIFMTLKGRAEEALAKHWGVIEKNLHRPQEVESLIWADVVSRGTTILQKRTYRTVQSELRAQGGTPDAAEAYLKNLARKSAYFSSILHPDREANSALRDALDRLTRAGGFTAFPIALWLFEQRHLKLLDNVQIVNGLKLIESFLVRRFLTGMSTNNLTSMFGSVLVRVNDKDSPIGDPIERLQDALMATPKDWPSDESLALGILREEFYLNQKTLQRILVLSSIDHHLAPNTVLNYAETDDSIEHILPQAVDAPDWESDLAELDTDLNQTQADWLHTLGNLTIVTPSENSKLGAKRFSEKVAIFADSQYRMTKDLASFRPDLTDSGRLWGPAAIQARAEALSQIAAEIWPRPTQSAAGGGLEDQTDTEFDADPDEDLVEFTSIAEAPEL